MVKQEHSLFSNEQIREYLHNLELIAVGLIHMFQGKNGLSAKADKDSPHGLVSVNVPLFSRLNNINDEIVMAIATEKLVSDEDHQQEFSVLEPLLRHVSIELRLILETQNLIDKYVRLFGVKAEFASQLEFLTYKNADELKELAAKFSKKFPHLKIGREAGIATYKAVFAIIQKEIDLRPGEEGLVCIQITKQDIRKLARLLHEGADSRKNLPLAYDGRMANILGKFGINYVFQTIKANEPVSLMFDLPEVMDSPLREYIIACDERLKFFSRNGFQKRLVGLLIQIMRDSPGSFEITENFLSIDAELVCSQFNDLNVLAGHRKFDTKALLSLVSKIEKKNGFTITSLSSSFGSLLLLNLKSDLNMLS